MKLAAIAIAAIVATTNVVTGSLAGVKVSASNPATTVLSQSEALEAAQHTATPDGVELTGAIDKIDQPSDAKETLEALQTKQEGFGWGLGGWGSWGGWGGWGGFGPYRFGFRCGGIPGWAYPLTYWNLFGASLYGGGCGLGIPFGGLYYC